MTRMTKHALRKTKAQKLAERRTPKTRVRTTIRDLLVEVPTDGTIEMNEEEEETTNMDDTEMISTEDAAPKEFSETDKIALSSGKPTAAIRLKTKEEKQKIRLERQKKNRQKNLWKIRTNYFSGKNGPRAINKVSNA